MNYSPHLPVHTPGISRARTLGTTLLCTAWRHHAADAVAEKLSTTVQNATLQYATAVPTTGTPLRRNPRALRAYQQAAWAWRAAVQAPASLPAYPWAGICKPPTLAAHGYMLPLPDMRHSAACLHLGLLVLAIITLCYHYSSLLSAGTLRNAPHHEPAA